MSSVLLENRPVEFRNAQKDEREKMKRSFFVSLGIHASLLLTILIAAAIPHRFHFEQMTMVELAGLKAGGGASVAGTKSATPSSPAAKPAAASLKLKARSVKAPVPNAKAEKISLKPNKKSAESKAEPTPSLKDRVLQKFSAMNTAQAKGSSSANAAGTGSAMSQGLANAADLQGIGTDVPFPFASYLADVRDKITDLWEEPSWISANASGAKAIVVFRIGRDGGVTKVLLAVPSGMTALDKSAVQAVEAADPLPPLPAEFKDAFLDIHLEFELSR